MPSYKYLKKVREEVVCKCGEKFTSLNSPMRWHCEEYPNYMAGMEEVVVPHIVPLGEEEGGNILHMQTHKCFCGATICILLRTEEAESALTEGVMEVYPTHNEVLNQGFLPEEVA